MPTILPAKPLPKSVYKVPLYGAYLGIVGSVTALALFSAQALPQQMNSPLLIAVLGYTLFSILIALAAKNIQDFSFLRHEEKDSTTRLSTEYSNLDLVSDLGMLSRIISFVTVTGIALLGFLSARKPTPHQVLAREPYWLIAFAGVAVLSALFGEAAKLYFVTKKEREEQPNKEFPFWRYAGSIFSPTVGLAGASVFAAGAYNHDNPHTLLVGAIIAASAFAIESLKTFFETNTHHDFQKKITSGALATGTVGVTVTGGIASFWMANAHETPAQIFSPQHSLLMQCTIAMASTIAVGLLLKLVLPSDREIPALFT